MVVWWLMRPLPVLTVTTWPGPYGRAQANAMFHPFGEKQRVDVRIAEYDGGLDHLRNEMRTRDYDWDVVDFELADAVRACHEGLLAHVDPSRLPDGANGASARVDFMPGANGPCWVGSVVYAQVIAYAPHRFTAPPKRAADFFDTADFPGGRALHRGSAKLNLELALLADGVSPDNVYPTLSTPAGIKRALNKLSTIRSSIAWWSKPSEALDMLEDGRASMTTALNSDVFDAQIRGRSVGVIWDRQLDELDVFGVPAGDPRQNLAMSFVRFATGTVPLARVADWLPFGPARRSALPLVGDNPERGIRMTPYLPTAPRNSSTAFSVNDEWWREHGPAISDQWQAWLNQGG